MKYSLLIVVLFSFYIGISQSHDQRILNIQNHLDSLTLNNKGLKEIYKTEIQVNNITLTNFLIGISKIHDLNIDVDPELNQINISNNFTNVSVSDILVYLCKTYVLDIDFSGNILRVKKYAPITILKEPVFPISYDPLTDQISLDLKNDKLYNVFKQIMDETGKNLVFAPGIDNKTLTAYIQNTPFELAMQNLAFSNNLYVKKSKNGFYVFEDGLINTSNPTNTQTVQRVTRRGTYNFHYEVLDSSENILKVDFENVPIAEIVHNIGNDLSINMFTATSLDRAGTATFRAESISFDQLLLKLFEVAVVPAVEIESPKSRNSNVNVKQDEKVTESFTFKKEDNIYYFGTDKQLSVRTVKIIPLKYRSIALLKDPEGISKTNNNFRNSLNGLGANQFDNYNQSQYDQNQSTNARNNSNSTGKNPYSDSESLLYLIPEEISEPLNIIPDYELNSFYVVGPGAAIERFKDFVQDIDKPVPMVLIEVMILEVSKSSTVETGVSWGIGENAVDTQGKIFPQTDLTLGAKTINKIIGGFDGFGSFNLGKVVPNFFATIKAMETNGDLKIRSTPKLATLNGHRATFSNGQTSYYAVTQRNIYGTNNPQTSELTNYFPINVELGLSIKPSVSSNGQVLLDISVVQSSFGNRIAEDAPPDINSRTFNSIIRMADQDIAVLGGLEEEFSNNTGSGVPFLARVPIIKWLFSQRKREGKKSKLTVLIKPTIIY